MVNVSMTPMEAGVYAMPKVWFRSGAVAAAEEAGIRPIDFYCKKGLSSFWFKSLAEKKTGIRLVPDTEFL